MKDFGGGGVWGDWQLICLPAQSAANLDHNRASSRFAIQAQVTNRLVTEKVCAESVLAAGKRLVWLRIKRPYSKTLFSMGSNTEWRRVNIAANIVAGT